MTTSSPVDPARRVLSDAVAFDEQDRRIRDQKRYFSAAKVDCWKYFPPKAKMSKRLLPIATNFLSLALNWSRITSVLAAYGPSLLGGMLIGLATALLFVLNGRIAGITGIAASLGQRWNERVAANLLFVVGLLLGAPAYRLGFGAWPDVEIIAPTTAVVVAGLLVGFGSRLGSGCTSGHGVAGLSRLSPRSIVAVLTFVAAAMLTVLVIRNLGL